MAEVWGRLGRYGVGGRSEGGDQKSTRNCGLQSSAAYNRESTVGPLKIEGNFYQFFLLFFSPK